MVQSEQFITKSVETADGPLKHIVIEDVSPSVDGGRYAVKRVAGEPCVIEADIFRDGHQVIRAAIKYRRKADESFSEVMMTPLENDRWRGTFVPADTCRYLYTIESWTDLFASWLSDFRKKVIAGREVHADLLEGIALIESILRTAGGHDREVLTGCVERLRRSANGFNAALDFVSHPEVAAAAL
ncbi:MAG: DUF3416 domain-containing protein, partial [Deltaproteobacteria bacterium]|nr:DUF3416 domain-containing protein [Deltaproteobacteria bacterium]